MSGRSAKAAPARLLAVLAALVVLVLPGPGRALEPVHLTADRGYEDMSGRVAVLRDPSGDLGIGDIVRTYRDGGFTPLTGNLRGGLSRAVFWLAVPMIRERGAPDDWMLEVTPPFLEHVDLYEPTADGDYRLHRHGFRQPFAEREIAARTLVFELLPPDSVETVAFLRIRTTGSIVAHVSLWNEREFIRNVGNEGLLIGILHGVTIILILGSVILYLLIRERVYLIYTAYMFTSAVYMFIINGFVAQFLGPALSDLQNIIMRVFAYTSLICGLAFASAILDMPRNYPRIHRLYRVMMAVVAVALVPILLGGFALVAPLLYAIILVTVVVSPIAALRLSLRGDRPAIFYLMAFSVYFGTIAVQVLALVGVPVSLTVATWGPQVGLAFHAILLSFGLSQRILSVEHDKHRAQASRLEAAQRTEQELETRVAERTAELNREIAERAAAEDLVRESERQVRAILQAAPFPMLVTRLKDGKVLFANASASSLLGVADTAVVGQPVQQFYAEPLKRDDVVRRLMLDGAILGDEIVVQRSDGGQRWVMLSAVRFRFGAQDAKVTCLNDITARKELEERLREAKVRSDTALATQVLVTREQRNFLAMVGHEFRTPLSIIGAAADVLELLYVGKAGALDELAKVRRATVRLTGLIDSCLADEWLDSTMTGLRVRPVDLGEILQTVCEERKAIASQWLALEHPGEPVLLEGDASLLAVVFSNLIDNAIKYSPAATTIRTRLERDGETVVVNVADEGPGLAPEDIPHVFEKYYRANSAMMRSGAGLGLHLVKRIVDRHGGTVAVDSAPGRGATFTVRLPQRQEASGAIP